jgi:hypothetical protein
MTTHRISGNTADRRAANNRIRGMKLLPQAIRGKLPPLYAQDGKGGKAIAHVKYFTPSSSWTWYLTYVELGISCIMWSEGLCGVCAPDPHIGSGRVGLLL